MWESVKIFFDTFSLEGKERKLEYAVLMSVYRKEQPAFLKESIDSLLVQTVLPAQIVIVCDGELTPALYEVLDVAEKTSPALFTRHLVTIHALLGFAPQKGMLGYYKMPACLCQDLFPRFLLISIYFYLFGNLILWILFEIFSYHTVFRNAFSSHL